MGRLLEIIYIVLAILWLYRQLSKPSVRPQNRSNFSPPPRPPQPQPAEKKVEVEYRKFKDGEGEYVDYEEVK